MFDMQCVIHLFFTSNRVGNAWKRVRYISWIWLLPNSLSLLTVSFYRHIFAFTSIALSLSLSSYLHLLSSASPILCLSFPISPSPISVITLTSLYAFSSCITCLILPSLSFSFSHLHSTSLVSLCRITHTLSLSSHSSLFLTILTQIPAFHDINYILYLHMNFYLASVYQFHLTYINYAMQSLQYLEQAEYFKR